MKVGLWNARDPNEGRRLTSGSVSSAAGTIAALT